MPYLKIMQLGFKRAFVYRGKVILLLLSSIASIFILQKFWLALYGDDYTQYIYMANYAMVSQILRIVYRINAPGTLSGRIRTGAISVELLRPWEYMNSLLFEDFGTIVANLASSGLVLFIMARLLFDMQIPPIGNIVLFLVSAFLGFLLLFLVKAIVAMACFWLTEAFYLLILVDVVIDLLSGQFLPTWLERIMNALPFVWIYQKPISLYLSQEKTMFMKEYVPLFLQQIAWAVFLYLMMYVVWHTAVKKLNVQGG
jgi:ABC-2 type transport system permease protein